MRLCQCRSDADEYVHPTALQHVVDSPVKGLVRDACLQQVAEDDDGTVLVASAPALEVKGDVESGKVGIVCIVDECDAAYSLLHLQPHGHRLQPGRLTGNGIAGGAQEQSHGNGMYGILYRGIVGKGYSGFVLVLTVTVAYERVSIGAFYAFHE